MYIFKNHVLYGIISLILLFCINSIQSMESESEKLVFLDPTKASKLIFIKTSDNNISGLEYWKVISLPILKERLNQQTTINSKENPIDITNRSEITKNSLQGVSNHFDKVRAGNIRITEWIANAPEDRLKNILIESFPDNIQEDIKKLDIWQISLVFELLYSKVAGIKNYFSSNDPKMRIYTSLPDSIKNLLPLSSWWESFYSRQQQKLKYGLGLLGLGALIGTAYYTQQK